jgi:NAD(P)-dependent dehydrogenase (short-subunit alcohol dehydrogenase family)
MSDPGSIAALADQVDQPIHRWISCTGILAGDHGQPEKTLRQLSSGKLQIDYQVNALGPLTAFSSLANHLRSEDMRAVFLSAQVGSIEDNRLGGWYGYRMSKAALNMGVRCLAIECARWRSAPVIVAVHPGTTVTNLSRAFTKTRKAPVQSAATCARQLKLLVETLDSGQSGQFLTLNGQTLPW